MGLERLDGGLREERQERQLHALAGARSRPWPAPQLGDARDVGLDDGRQLCADCQRLDHALGDDGAQPRQLLGAPPHRGVGVAAGSGRPGCWGCGRRSRLGGPARRRRGRPACGCVRRHRVPDTDAEVDALVGGQAAHQRRDVGARAIARSLWSGALTGGGLGRHGLRRRGGRRRGPVRRRGTGGLLRRRLGALRSRLLCLGRFLLRRLLLRLLLCLLPGRRRGPAAAPDHRQLGADLDGLVLADEDLGQRAGHGRRDLGVDLVGRDLEQRLVDLDLLTLLLEPAGDRALGDALAQGRHGHRGALAVPSAAAGAAGVAVRAAAGRLRRGLALRLLRGLCLTGRLGRGVHLLVGGRRRLVRFAGSTAGTSTSAVAVAADDGEFGADLDGLVLATRILVSTPAAGEGISVSTLSVETSSSGSSTSTCSPSCLSQRVTVPSVTLSPRAGMVTDVGIAGSAPSGVGERDERVDQPCTCRGLPARARWASPSASLCVGCGWMRLATSSASASQL